MAVSSSGWNYLARGDFVYREELPIEAVSARGATIRDVKGKSWIDLEAANGSALFGYDASVVASVGKHWETLPTIPSFVESNARRIYADRLGRKIEDAVGQKGKLAFELGGAQGIELALRLASCHYPNRRTVVVLDGGYHGRTLSISNLSASFRYRETLPASGFRVIRLPVPSLLAAPGVYTEEEATKACERLAVQTFLDQGYGVTSNGKTDALALIIEPVLNVAGLIDPGAKYLSTLIELAKSIGCITIADEVFTGCYRLGTFLGSQAFSKIPDIIVMSKALTNGLVPLSAVWAQRDIAGDQHFPPGTYSTTFSNTPLNFMVANKIFDMINGISEVDISRVNNFLLMMVRAITKAFPEYIVMSQVRGMTAVVECASEKQKNSLIRHLRSTDDSNRPVGLLCASTGLNKTRVMLHPPITISDEEMALAMAIAECGPSGCGPIAAE